MLVLSRKPGEQILVGDTITITVVRIGPNTVRIGIDAPGDLSIVRAELTEAEFLDLQGASSDAEVLIADFDEAAASLDSTLVDAELVASAYGVDLSQSGGVEP